MVGLFGPSVVCKREGERGIGRARSRSSVGHWDVARGRDERGSHLQSVPVGQENHLWARRILAAGHENTTVKKKKEKDGKKERRKKKKENESRDEKESEKKGGRRAMGPMRTN